MQIPGLPGESGTGVLFVGLRTPGRRPPRLADLPATAGAYVLYFTIESPRRLAIRSLGNPLLTAGAYVYCGNAHGPGGLRARVMRHLAPDKRRHWHVDYLAVSECRAVAIQSGSSECGLVDGFLAAGGRVLIPGFGSSDCRRCLAHLVRLDDDARSALYAVI